MQFIFILVKKYFLENLQLLDLKLEQIINGTHGTYTTGSLAFHLPPKKNLSNLRNVK